MGISGPGWLQHPWTDVQRRQDGSFGDDGNVQTQRNCPLPLWHCCLFAGGVLLLNERPEWIAALPSQCPGGISVRHTTLVWNLINCFVSYSLNKVPCCHGNSRTSIKAWDEQGCVTPRNSGGKNIRALSALSVQSGSVTLSICAVRAAGPFCFDLVWERENTQAGLPGFLSWHLTLGPRKRKPNSR